MPGVVLVAAACTGAYAVASWLVASLVGALGRRWRCSSAPWPSGAWAASSARCGRRVSTCSVACRPGRGPLPRAAGAGLATLAAASVLTLGVAVGAHTRQISALQGDLDGRRWCGLLVALYAAYLPNVLGWAGSYALGSATSAAQYPPRSGCSKPAPD